MNVFLSLDESLLVYLSYFFTKEEIANLSSTCSELNNRLCNNSNFQLTRFRKLWELQSLPNQQISWRLLRKYHFDQERLWSKLVGFWRTRMTEEYIRAHPLTSFQNLDRLIYLNYIQVKNDRSLIHLMNVPLKILSMEMVPEVLKFLQTHNLYQDPLVHYFTSQAIFEFTLLTRMECIGFILYAEVYGYLI